LLVAVYGSKPVVWWSLLYQWRREFLSGFSDVRVDTVGAGEQAVEVSVEVSV
jgi:hypothetical protein